MNLKAGDYTDLIKRGEFPGEALLLAGLKRG
jgi:hypothetical protein